MKAEREAIADIKNALQHPQTILEIMKDKRGNQNKIPIEDVDNGLKAIRRAVRLLNKLAKW